MERFAKAICAACDDEFENMQTADPYEHDRILSAMALAAVSAATGIIMEITDEKHANLVVRQCERVIRQTFKVKRTRDNG